MNRLVKIKSESQSKELSIFLLSIIREYSSFFHYRVSDPLIFIIDNKKDLDLIIGRKTEKWFVAFTKNNCIYILDKKNFFSESIHKKNSFWQTLRHEYSHIYYTQITNSHNPRWLNEGLAGYLSKKDLIIDTKIKNKLYNIFYYFDKCDSDTYRIGQYWVGQMIKKYGRQKLIRLVKSLDIKEELNDRNFAKQFYKIYGFYFNKNNFVKFLK